MVLNSSSELIKELHGQILIATLNRPDKGNSINQEMMTGLDELCSQLEETTSELRVLIITGAGSKSFCAGADVSELAGLSRTAAREQMVRGQRVFERIEHLQMPVIAALNGFALGGGLELAMAADIRVAAEAVMLGQPEITLANLPGWGGTQRLPRLVGRGLASELILMGGMIDSKRALSMGLVNHVVEDALVFALDLGAHLATMSPTAVRGAKSAIRIGLEEGIERGSEAEADAVADCCETDEQHQAVERFLNRKKSMPTESRV